MPGIAETATLVAAAGVPVLFLDTCSILDVIRAPVRGLVGCVEAASELIALASGSRCGIVVGSFVRREWDDHDEPVLGELTKHLERMDAQAGHVHDLCMHLALGLAFDRPGYRVSGLSTRLHDLSRQLLHSAIALDPHADTNGRAYTRVIGQRRPCRKGGELKDCTIFEECLEVCRQLQAVTFAPKMVFCSSNTDDYCAPRVVPHADVATDCAAVGLQFTTSLPWAVSELKS